ncbi:hypothetical protein LZZ85_01720 [Terrimonas sp. NA20]|uniref:Outer membrane lipoprotein-sorting protein n=1 Tax=Terrimonas ginsenosidimutans TaxID=2908004 RepID=A0ABS9KKX1_9BACT|nr:hypothetical protein [Terrimonas ginsenosidimutans]MCG2612970.1 hypothetical protein [Terrimonas ginsenosidimutans]
MIRGTIALLMLMFYLPSIAADTTWIKNAQRKIQPFERRYLQYTEQKDGKVRLSCILTRKAQKISYEGSGAMLFTQKYQLEKGTDTDSSIVNSETLLPLGYFTEIQSEGHREKVLFSPERVHNTVIYKDSTSIFEKAGHQWFNGVITDDIIGSLPMKKGAVFSFQAINPGKRYYEYVVVITIEGKEDLSIPGVGNLPCWRVRIGDEKDGVTEWYTIKEQLQVKKIARLRNGNVFHRVLIAG